MAEDESAPKPAEGSLTPSWVWPIVAIAAVAGSVLRYWIYSTPMGQLDSDEAVWGLMTRHLFQGDFSPFFWGQAQGGTIEVILTAPFHALLGQSQLTLTLVPLLLTIAAAVITWRIGLRIMGQTGALIAAALFWVWPAYVLWKSIKAHGFYGAGVVLCLLGILFALRLREDSSRANAIVFGLVLGLAWWTTAQVTVVFIPLLLWLVLARPAVLKKIAYIATAAACGGAVWLVHNAPNGWPSITSETNTPGENYLSQLEGALTIGYPGILGLRAPWTQQWLFSPWIGRSMYAALIAGFVYLIFRASRQSTRNPGVLLLAAIVVMHPFIFALSNQGYYVGEPRYFYLVAPVLALLIAHAVSRWTLQKAVMCLGFGLLSTGAGLAFMDQHDVTTTLAPNVPMPPDYAPLLAALERENVKHAYANYWLAYPITYLSENRVIASPNDPFNRNPAYANEVAADPEAAHVFVIGASDAPAYTEALEASGVPYERIETGGFVIYIPHPS